MQYLRKAIPLVLLFSAAALAQRPSRIRSQVDDSVVTRVPASAHRGIARAVDNGRVAPDEIMPRMQLTLSSGPEQLAALEQLLRDQQDPSSPQYHQWLTPQQFGQQFGPSPAELDQVTAWLGGQGFTVNSISPGRRSVEFSGSIRQVEQAFHTEMHHYTLDGVMHIANSTDISVPAALASVVTGIVSLNDFRSQPQHRVISSTASSLLTSPAYNNGGGSHTLTPFDYAIIYNINPVWNSLKIDGTGQNIAVISRSNIDLTDVSTFRSDYGMQPASVQVLLNGADPGIQTASGDDIEASLDVEWSGAVAKGATIIMVTSANTRTSDGVDLSATYAVNNNVAPVITMSYGSCEAGNGPFNNFYNSLWQQAAAQGISVFVSSGDDGSAGCDDQTSSQPASHPFGVSGLASTPYNVAVGGTEFNEGPSGTYWASSNSAPQVSSALSYIPEVVWNESAYVNAGNADNGLWASSGGVSMLYATPAWQAAPGVPASDPGTLNSHHRYLPDVSLTAADHDGYLVQAEGKTYRVSGTSASAPSFAGVMAMINQYTNTRSGLPNPKLYALAQSTPGVFHDVVSGTNAVPCLDSPLDPNPSCTGPAIVQGVNVMGGYNAGVGYDLATGLGSVDVYQLVTNFGPASSSGGTGGGSSGGSGGTGGGTSSTLGTPPPAGTTNLSGAHIATGGGWQTLIELINPTASSATAHLRLYDDNGNTLSVPLVSSDGTVNTTASALDPTLGPQSVLILKSAATGAVLTGSTEVTSNSAISGFVIFSYTPTGQDVLVPLSSTTAGTYSIPFDNTGGLSTGIAIASSSTQAITVGITAMDQNGQQLISPTSVSITALGHLSFVAASQIPALANTRGTLIFTPPSGQQISLVGIRATAAGAFTGIPVLANGSTGSGTLSDLASGGGWTTLIELANANSSSSLAHLRFYADDGSLLSLPVSSSDLGISATTSAVDTVLLPNSSALIQTTADPGSPLVGGSARLSSDPGVTGFLIFQYSSGENVLVSAQGSNAASYLVAFDQTNGLSTGISLANTTTQNVTVTAYLRDQNGNNLASTFINLPPQGHQSFVLTSVFPAAIGQYGTVQFVPGSGQQIGVVGIRYTSSGAFTSIPILTP